MTITEIDDIELEDVYWYLPEPYLRRLDIMKNAIDKIYMYVVSENGLSVGLAVYLTFNTYTNLAMLIHIKMLEDYRAMGLGKKLIEKSTMALKGHGKSAIYAVNMELFEDTVPPFLQKAGFSEVTLEHTLGYTYKDLQNSIILEYEDKLHSLGKNLKKYNQLTKSQIQDFSEYMKSVYSDVDFEKIDSSYTKYYVKDNQIVGYLPMAETGNNVYLLDTMVIRADSNSSYIVPVFLCDLVKNVLNSDNEDIELRIAFYLSDNEKAAKSYLGECSFEEMNHYWKYTK